MNGKPFEQVREFHQAFGHPVNERPIVPQQDTIDLRVELIREEFEDELLVAVEDNDIVAIADALGDLIYVINGMALCYGIPLDAVVDEIHRSNMTKLGADGKPIYREDGKVLKGPGYEPPMIGDTIQAITGVDPRNPA